MNIEYEVTVEDDLNAHYTNWVLWLKEGKVIFFPSRYLPLSIFVASIGFIIWELLTQVREDRYFLLGYGAFLFLISILLFFLYKPKNVLSSLNRKEIEKEHKKYSPVREQRSIILTEEEFILKTDFSETAWSWQALKSDKEERYLMLCIYSFGFLLFFARLFPKLNPLAYWNTKKDLQENFVKQEAKQISITKKGIAIASQNYREYHQWQGITKTAENKKIFLLYHSRNQECTIVPKIIFATEAELTNFRDSTK